MSNLLGFYRKSDGATKKKMAGYIFVEKLVLEKGEVAIRVFTEPIQLILRICEVLGSSPKKTRDRIGPLVPLGTPNVQRLQRNKGFMMLHQLILKFSNTIEIKVKILLK
jgi:hypothetical protein